MKDKEKLSSTKNIKNWLTGIFKKLKETIKDWKDFILLCISVVLIAGCFFISKMFDFFVIHKKRERSSIRSYLKTTCFCHHNPIEA